jgi:pyruvate formate lyase activating enzyme
MTGLGNELLLENLQKLDQAGKSIEIRIPLIPDFNSTPEALTGYVDILSKLENLTSVKVLPFHHARFKYQALDMTEPLKDLAACSDELAEEVKAFFRKNNINVSDN